MLWVLSVIFRDDQINPHIGILISKVFYYTRDFFLIWMLMHFINFEIKIMLYAKRCIQKKTMLNKHKKIFGENLKYLNFKS